MSFLDKSRRLFIMLDSFSGYFLVWKCLICGNSSVVEHNLAKVGVASSSLVSRSSFPPRLSRYRHNVFNFPIVQKWRGGRVVMQRPAKPCTAVRFRSSPPLHMAYIIGSMNHLVMLHPIYKMGFSHKNFKLTSRYFLNASVKSNTLSRCYSLHKFLKAMAIQ